MQYVQMHACAIARFFVLLLNPLFPYVVYNWKIGVICFVVHCSCVGCMSTFCHHSNFYLLRCIVSQNDDFFRSSFRSVPPRLLYSILVCIVLTGKNRDGERVEEVSRWATYALLFRLRLANELAPCRVGRVAACTSCALSHCTINWRHSNKRSNENSTFYCLMKHTIKMIEN